jgi:hypothetical protein
MSRNAHHRCALVAEVIRPSSNLSSLFRFTATSLLGMTLMVAGLFAPPPAVESRKMILAR